MNNPYEVPKRSLVRTFIAEVLTALHKDGEEILLELEKAYASGTTRITHRGKVIEYKDLPHMERTISKLRSLGEKGERLVSKWTRAQNAAGTKAWYLGDVLHRVNGPAVEFADGSKLWLQHGNLHREDGPAVEMVTGGGVTKCWFRNGEPYREDGGQVVEAPQGVKVSMQLEP